METTSSQIGSWHLLHGMLVVLCNNYASYFKTKKTAATKDHSFFHPHTLPLTRLLSQWIKEDVNIYAYRLSSSASLRQHPPLIDGITILELFSMAN